MHKEDTQNMIIGGCKLLFSYQTTNVWIHKFGSEKWKVIQKKSDSSDTPLIVDGKHVQMMEKGSMGMGVVDAFV